MTSTTNQVTRAIIALALTATTGSALAHSGLHAAGALYQHFWLKTDVLKRMTHG